MASLARTFGWYFLRQHRWGFVAVGLYLVALTVFKLAEAGAESLDSEQFAFRVSVPVTAAYMYLLSVFSFGFSGDLAARESLYPARMFTLPVTTNALVAYPMLFGMIAMVLLWLATALLGLWPAGLRFPLIWPALFGAVFLGWAQALTWMPYGLRGTRVLLAAAWLVTIDTIVLLAIYLKAPGPLMIALLAPQLPLAYLTARYAVAAGRRGHVPDWSGALAGATGRRVSRRRARPFASPAQALLWVEWREHGRALLALVAMLLPFELALLFVAGESAALVLTVVLAVLVTPPAMALCTAATMRATTPFDLARPATNTTLIAAKLEVALLSTVLTWLLVGIAIPLGLTASNTWWAVRDFALYLDKYIGTARSVAFLLLVFAFLFTMTWKHLVQSLYISLTGRTWLMKGAVFVALLGAMAIVPIGQWLLDNHARLGALWSALRWVLAGLVGIKLASAAVVALRLYHGHRISDELLVGGAALWTLSVLAVQALLVWLLATPHVPGYVLTLIAILVVPLTRISAAPLALAWNRHQ